ncbi:DEAD/DEAH box helicase [Sutcliffiella rhizosphaerae]|uniref:DEAD-box ATP-dependent RNA helicase CshE n=1 Tax=Sutcliffiella rhizosphaerae TaxID=2880967 RepID=A0ABM8YRQ1_9BACI|nr:DEAD/DEAH box helicase [Sutcliffiella rhizosphaerae]CAG9622664.1 DEAD-box ATP-dependent RNA helicase CshE [Sutcliffiella rhizosphaerae]
MTDFLSLGISKKVNHTLKSLGVTAPTDIQKLAIPAVLKGQDIIAQSKTGTGKTYAFILPILEKINVRESETQALILTPTRELALQITKELKKLKENIEGVNVLAIFGGQDVQSQMKKLQGAQHIIVATPGRLLDHVRRGTVDLSTVSIFVMDEADQMLLMGFLPEIDSVTKDMFASRQTIAISATIPDELHALAKKYMNSPVHLNDEEEKAEKATIEYFAVETTDRRKERTMVHLTQIYNPFLAIVFCRTKARVQKLTSVLKENGVNCEAIHGDIPQSKRNRAMKWFREAKIQYLIATDVAARGLDVEGVTHIFNYDIPQDLETFIHRTGRTGRAGGTGEAYTLYTPGDIDYLKVIENDMKQTMEKMSFKGISIPDREDYEEERNRNILKARNDRRKKETTNYSSFNKRNRKG